MYVFAELLLLPHLIKTYLWVKMLCKMYHFSLIYIFDKSIREGEGMNSIFKKSIFNWPLNWPCTAHLKKTINFFTTNQSEDSHLSQRHTKIIIHNWMFSMEQILLLNSATASGTKSYLPKIFSKNHVEFLPKMQVASDLSSF